MMNKEKMSKLKVSLITALLVGASAALLYFGEAIKAIIG